MHLCHEHLKFHERWGISVFWIVWILVCRHYLYMKKNLPFIHSAVMAAFTYIQTRRKRSFRSLLKTLELWYDEIRFASGHTRMFLKDSYPLIRLNKNDEPENMMAARWLCILRITHFVNELDRAGKSLLV